MRVKDELRRSVVFFGKQSMEGITYGGTGFLVSYTDGDLLCPYLVTARHVAKHLMGEFVIRSNYKSEAIASEETAGTLPVGKVNWT